LTRRDRSGEYEEIRILGLDTPEDEIGPGRSVFADDPSEDLLPHAQTKFGGRLRCGG